MAGPWGFKVDHRADEIQKMIKDYATKITEEKDYLVARYMLEFGLSSNDIVLVEEQTQTGYVFYPDLKSNHLDKGIKK